mgnify:CR=1 FL=1
MPVAFEHLGLGFGLDLFILEGADLIAQYLIEKGSPVNAKNNRGLTPLDYAMGKQVVSQLQTAVAELAPGREIPETK